MWKAFFQRFFMVNTRGNSGQWDNNAVNFWLMILVRLLISRQYVCAQTVVLFLFLSRLFVFGSNVLLMRVCSQCLVVWFSDWPPKMTIINYVFIIWKKNHQKIWFAMNEIAKWIWCWFGKGNSMKEIGLDV